MYAMKLSMCFIINLTAAVLLIKSCHCVKRQEKQIRGDKLHTTLFENVPDSWDWRDHIPISPVVDAGSFNISFPLAIADAINSYAAIQNGHNISTSVQELRDCCAVNNYTADIYQCVAGMKGLCSTNDYPSWPQFRCNEHFCYPAVTIHGGYYVQPLNETDLKLSVYKNPAVVLLNAAAISFRTYHSGVYNDRLCHSKRVNHALLVVGYGQIDGVDVWICKNSWGVNWGVQGYIYIARGRNICGIATMPSIPI